MNENMNQYLEKAKVLIEALYAPSESAGRTVDF